MINYIKVEKHRQLYSGAFFSRPTVQVARELLGSELKRRLASGEVVAASIVEVEAYTQDDPASHAFRGPTDRCRVMFGPAGHAYVYFIYGMYNCLNVVTEEEGIGGAVLIRAIGIEGGRGPGKLCQTLSIDRSLNGVSLIEPNSALWIEPGGVLPDDQVGSSVRIGINVAVDKVWRFYTRNSPYVSGPRRLGGAQVRRPKI